MDSLPLHYSHVMILLIPPKTEKNNFLSFKFFFSNTFNSKIYFF